MLIDSPYFPDELEALPGLLAGAGSSPTRCSPPTRTSTTCWVGSRFPGSPLGLGEPSVERLHREPGAAQRDLRDDDDEFYVERARAAGARTGPGRCRCPGSVELGSEELELHPAEGHTADGLAVMARWCGVLCAGDYLSRVEIPMIHAGGSLTDYRSTLARLAPLVEAADAIVPGHGAPNDRETALRILDEDVDYLDALERGEEKPALPKGRDSGEQRDIHARNLKVLG